jgi:hypothetical protein
MLFGGSQSRFDIYDIHMQAVDGVNDQYMYLSVLTGAFCTGPQSRWFAGMAQVSSSLAGRWKKKEVRIIRQPERQPRLSNWFQSLPLAWHGYIDVVSSLGNDNGAIKATHQPQIINGVPRGVSDGVRMAV